MRVFDIILGIHTEKLSSYENVISPVLLKNDLYPRPYLLKNLDYKTLINDTFGGNKDEAPKTRITKIIKHFIVQVHRAKLRTLKFH